MTMRNHSIIENVTQHSKIRNKSGLPNLANQLQSVRMGIFGWKGRFSDIGEFS